MQLGIMILALLGSSVLSVLEFPQIPSHDIPSAATPAWQAEYPNIPVYTPPGAPRNHNARAHEDVEVVRAAHDTPICVPPVTQDLGSTPSHWRGWAGPDSTLLRSPHDVWIDPLDWEKMDKWWSISMDEARRAESFLVKGAEYRFKFSRFEGLGGKYGLVLGRDRMKPEYRNHV